MSDYIKQNALNAIAKSCLSAMQQCDREDVKALASAVNPWAQKAALLGFSRIDLLVYIGRITGRLQER